MPYAIEYLGLRGTCNSPEEFIRLAKCLQRQEPSSATSTIGDAVNHMSEQGRKFFEILSQIRTPIPVSLLKQQMALSANQFSGIITGIKLKLRAGGFDPDRVLIKQANGGEDRYSIAPEVADDLRIALKVIAS